MHMQYIHAPKTTCCSTSIHYISRKKGTGVVISAPSCFREKQQAGKCSQKWWSEKERRNIMPCQDWNKTTRDVPTGRPKKDQRRPWRSYKSRRQAAALLSCCKCAAELACLPACMPAHSNDEAKQACMGRSNAEPRRNSIPKRE